MARKYNTQTQLSLLEKMDNHLEKKETLYFWVLFGICLLFCILLYDPRVSQAGDDSGYILKALDFGKKFTFPGFQGPLYPILLSPITLLFGISLFPLKLFSMCAMMVFFYCTYRTFRKRIPATLLFTILLLTAINSQVLYYSSQTFSEALYMLIQALVLFVFVRFFSNAKMEVIQTGSFLKQHAWLALTILALALTRSVGFSAIIAVVGYFIFYQQWKNAGISLLCFVLFFLAYQGLKWAAWGDGGIQFSTQGSSLMNKDYYQPQAGKEDLVGLIVRFWNNSQLYLSEILPSLMGIKTARPDANGEEMLHTSNALVTLLIYGIAGVGLFFSWKKNKSLFFSGLLCGSFLAVSFISLQTGWYQSRLIIPAYPLLILVLFTAIYYLLSSKRFRSFQFLFIIMLAVLFLGGMADTTQNIAEVQKIKNEYSGMTPDWVHYAEASAWVGKNLTENEITACRKPSISTIYSKGKDFYGIYTIPAEDSKSFMEDWKKQPEEYLVIKDSITEEQYNGFYSQIYARVGFLGEQFIFFKKDATTISMVDALQLPAINSADLIAAISNNPNNPPLIYSPDRLLGLLKEAKVTYILSANLRADPTSKEVGTISTVERYMYLVSEKYPNAFSIVQQIGQNNDEPAYIYKINWAGN